MNGEPFPLLEVLRYSLYYPASGFDGVPVKHFAGCVFSFVYVDNGTIDDITRQRLTDCLDRRGVDGYDLVGRRKVIRSELFPCGQHRFRRTPARELLSQLRGQVPRFLNKKTFFCDWLVFKRRGEENHGPSRISLLFIRAEGVRAFYELYVANCLAPKVVSVIGPDGNFRVKLFSKCVLKNPAGLPDILIYGVGGSGRCPKSLLRFYRKPCTHEWDSVKHKAQVRPHDMCRDISGSDYLPWCSRDSDGIGKLYVRFKRSRNELVQVDEVENAK